MHTSMHRLNWCTQVTITLTTRIDHYLVLSVENHNAEIRLIWLLNTWFVLINQWEEHLYLYIIWPSNKETKYYKILNLRKLNHNNTKYNIILIFYFPTLPSSLVLGSRPNLPIIFSTLLSQLPWTKNSLVDLLILLMKF